VGDTGARHRWLEDPTGSCGHRDVRPGPTEKVHDVVLQHVGNVGAGCLDTELEVRNETMTTTRHDHVLGPIAQPLRPQASEARVTVQLDACQPGVFEVATDPRLDESDGMPQSRGSPIVGAIHREPPRQASPGARNPRSRRGTEKCHIR
jgi:hypothetical protein